jgi:hypothetical protein
MRRPAVAVLLALLPALVAGCTGPAAETEGAAPACGQALDDPVLGCVDPRSLRLSLRGCQESGFLLDLPQRTYDLPPGFEDVPGPASPQRAYVSFADCEAASAGGRPLGRASFGATGVAVRTQDRGQGDGSTVFALEVVTDNPSLARLFGALGYAVADAGVAIADTGAQRSVRVAGEAVAYDAAVTFAPAPGGVGTAGVAWFLESVWFRTDYSCSYYALTGVAQFTAAQGRLAEAMPPQGGPLQGQGSQSVTCDLSVGFEPAPA